MEKQTLLAAVRSRIPAVQSSDEGLLKGGFAYIGGGCETQGNNTKCKNDEGCEGNKDSDGNSSCTGNTNCKNNSGPCKNNGTCKNNHSPACEDNSTGENQTTPTDCNCGVLEFGKLL